MKMRLTRFLLNNCSFHVLKILEVVKWRQSLAGVESESSRNP